MQLSFDSALISAFILALTRAGAWLVITPPLANRAIPSRVKIGLSAGLAIAAAPMVANPPPFGSVAFMNSLFLQLAVGFALGFMTKVLFSVFQMAGQLIDTFAGFSIAVLYDPMSESQSTIFGRLYELIAVTLFFVTGACNLMIRGFLTSFTAIPASGIDIDNLQKLLVNGMSTMLVAAIEIAGPVMVTLVLAEMVLGILAKAAPSLNVFAVGFPLRVIVAVVTITMAIPLLLPAIGSVGEQIAHNMGL